MKQRILVSALALSLALGAIPAHAQLFGESDKEKAARQAHEDGQDSQISQLGDRLRDLEDRVRSLESSLQRTTGNEENLGHQIDLLQGKIDQQQKDFSYRLCMLSAQQLGTSSDESGLNCAAAGTSSASDGGYLASPQSQGGNFTPGATLPPLGDSQGDNLPLRGRPPGNLGTLPAGPGGPSGPGATSPSPSSSSQDVSQFDAAMNLLGKQQFAQASAAFRSYADTHPDDQDLSPQALYWIGDIAYVQQDYGTAARAFAEQIKKFPNSSHSPDSMLKIGQSLVAGGQTKEGCTALGTITKKQYPKASTSTLAAAASARKVSCSR